MVMDPRLRGFIESIHSNYGAPPVSDQHHLTNILKLKQTCFDKKKNTNFMDHLPLPPPDPTNFVAPTTATTTATTTTTTTTSSSSSSSSSCSLSPDEYYCPEDCDFSDVVLKYISKMLMEEDMEDKNCMFQESSALQAAEKPFYEILGEKYPPSPDFPPPPPPLPPYLVDDHNLDSTQLDYFTGSYTNPYVDHNIESTQLDYFTGSNTMTSGGSGSSSSSNGNNAVETNLIGDLGDQYNHLKSSQVLHHFPTDYAFQATPTSQSSSLSSTHSVNSILDGLVDSPPVTSTSRVQVPDIFGDSQSFWQFQKGVEVANSFLPNDNDLIVSTESNGCFHQEPIRGYGVVVKMEKKDDREHSPNGSRGKKNLHRVDIDLEEGRINKQSAVFKEETVRTPMFDSVLLCNGDKGDAAVSNLREALQTETSKNAQQQQQQNGHSKGSNGGKSRGNKKQQSGRKDMVDLRTLLIHCAQAVAADDRRSASELLKQIRQHSSPFGDGSQRLAHCFADGLEARLAGTGSQIYASLVNKKTSAADILKAYQLYLAACPFKKVSNFYSNQTIMNLAENATSLHIVDFGIYYGFQWPCLIQRLSGRAGGPPKLRITGIDLPQPGFRPAERIEETGRRLANYAESFNVPFEYTAIAKKWENIQLEDLKIDRDEVLVVNCMYRFRNLLDETVVLDSPRSAVLQLVRKMNPNVFIHGVVNGAFSAPFFVTRFREALFHYSALFDILETNVPREHPERILLEKDLFGREALNVIACEGSERVERPETYKQWQVRNMRAGFKQLPLNQEIMKKARDRAKVFYHKDFVIDEDSQWLLQGWKGRIIYGLSTWRPAHNS